MLSPALKCPCQLVEDLDIVLLFSFVEVHRNFPGGGGGAMTPKTKFDWKPVQKKSLTNHVAYYRKPG